jgi:uncharacterized protein YdeI (YjbR/CyaY-like superfamily)
MSAKPTPDFIHPKSRAEWRAWLVRNHGRTKGLWVVTYKKSTGLPRLTDDEIIDEALCFGWIDSKSKALDEKRSMFWCAPRKAGTGWSRRNKERVQKLIAAGEMADAGMAKIKAAKKDGSWTALDAVEALVIPQDFEAALASLPHAAAHFEKFPPSAKRSILEWIRSAKKPETRLKRIEESARLANKNIRANQ